MFVALGEAKGTEKQHQKLRLIKKSHKLDNVKNSCSSTDIKKIKG